MNNPQNFVQRSVQNNIKIAVVDRDENERDKLIAYFKPKGYDVLVFQLSRKRKQRLKMLNGISFC
jgi:hypothetical protein